MPDSSNVQPITDCKLPESVSELRKFFKMVKFFRHNIRHAADHQRHLQCLIKTNVKNDKTLIEWTDDARAVFEELKNALINASYPRESANIVLCTDASDFVIGNSLYKMRSETLEPLVFYSRAFVIRLFLPF